MNAPFDPCEYCGRQVPPDAPGALCPSCLITGGLALEDPPAEAKHPSEGTPHGVCPEDVSSPGEAPRKLGNYELLEKIAQGGMGVVYKAWHTRLDRVVALKMIRAGVLATPRDVERFQREARSAAKLQHPNIVRIHDIGEQDGQHYYTMDYVPGENLAERARTRPFSARQAAEITAGVAGAIQYAHERGILHRDIKPANVILTPEEQPHILDFGLALVLADQSNLTLSGTPMGSPSYMPPEQAAGQNGRIDARSDVYGLGALLYELLSGHPPFQAASTVETLRLVMENEPVPPRQLNPALPRDLDTICLKCLEKVPERRYPSARDLGDELRRFMQDEPIRARPVAQIEKIWRWCRRKPLVAGLGAATLALLISVAIGSPVALYRINQERKETRRRAYAAEINVAFQALAENNLGRAIELLDRQRPEPGEEDLRGFEWRHLWQLCRPDEKFTFHDQGAVCAAFSPDGRWLAYAADKIIVRELPSRSEVRTISGVTSTLAFSPSGELLASGHASSVSLWNCESWEEVRSLTNARAPAVFSPDGQWLVTSTKGGYQVWNTATWQSAGFCPGEATFREQAYQSLAFSRDGKLLVTAGHPEGRHTAQFQVWDFPSLITRTNFEFFPFKLASAVFTPDGNHLLTGGWYSELLVWDVAAGRVVDSLKGHTGRITTIAYARDGRIFATASSDRTLIVWDGATRKMLVRLRGHLEELRAIALSPDGGMLASGSLGGTTKLWDASTRHEIRNLPGVGLIAGGSEDSRFVVSGGFREMTSWSLVDGTARTIPLDRFHFRGLDTWADVQGNVPHGAFGLTNGTVEFWDLGSMSRIKSWRISESGWIVAALSPDTRFVATSDGNREIKLWEVASQREVRRFPPSKGPIEFLTFSPNGRFLLTGAREQPSPVSIWDVDAGRLARELDTRGEYVRSLAFSPDSRIVATGGENNTTQLWDVPSGRLQTTLKGHTDAVMGVAFSPDGKTLATSSDDRRVKLWNLATEQEVATLEPLLTGGCRSIRFSPDGRALIVGHFLDPEPSTWAWQVPSFEEIAAAEAREKAGIQ